MSTDANEGAAAMDAWYHHLEEHYQRHFGLICEPIMHSTDDVDPHIDIYQFPPSEDREYWTLITRGMSNLPQTLADGRQHYTELLIYVREPQPWMFHALKVLAEFPTRYRTFFDWGHTINYGIVTNTAPSLLSAFILLPPFFEHDDFDTLKRDEDQVNFLWSIPITERERAYAEENGGMALADLMEKVGFDIVVNEERESIV